MAVLWTLSTCTYFQLLFSEVSQSDRCVKQPQAPASQQLRHLFDVKKVPDVLLRGLEEVAAAEPTGGSFSYACFFFFFSYASSQFFTGATK